MSQGPCGEKRGLVRKWLGSPQEPQSPLSPQNDNGKAHKYMEEHKHTQFRNPLYRYYYRCMAAERRGGGTCVSTTHSTCIRRNANPGRRSALASGKTVYGSCSAVHAPKDAPCSGGLKTWNSPSPLNLVFVTASCFGSENGNF